MGCQDRSRSVSKTYRPLALARLYGEFCMVQFRYCMVILWQKVSFSYSKWEKVSFANSNLGYFACVEISFIVEIALIKYKIES